MVGEGDHAGVEVYRREVLGVKVGEETLAEVAGATAEVEHFGLRWQWGEMREEMTGDGALRGAPEGIGESEIFERA